MKRRGFLAVLPFLAPAVAMAVPKPAEPDDFEWEGYRVKWRDYLGEQASDRLEGFWTAWPVVPDPKFRQPYIVAMTSRYYGGGAIVNRYSCGDTFPMGGQVVDRNSTEAEKASAKAAALSNLKQFILDEKKPKKEPEYTFKFTGFRPKDWLDGRGK